MRETITTAKSLVAEIGLRFKAGNPANGLIRRLEAKLSTLTRMAPGTADAMPAELRAEIAKLFALVKETVATGDEWLARTGPELAALHMRQRLKRAYGVP